MMGASRIVRMVQILVLDVDLLGGTTGSRVVGVHRGVDVSFVGERLVVAFQDLFTVTFLHEVFACQVLT